MAAGLPIACLTFVGDPSVDTRILRTADALSDDFDIHIIALTAARDIDVPGATVHTIHRAEGKPLRSVLFPFWREGAAKCAALNAELCLASDLYSLPASARGSRAAGAALVYDSRELYGAIAALQGRKLRQRFWNIIERRYAVASSAILTVNEEIARIIERQYPGIPVHVAYNVPMHSAAAHTAAADLRAAFSIPEGGPILISNGGLQKGRGLFMMIDMLERLPAAHLVFLGDGPLRSELELYAVGGDCADRVHFKHVPSTDVVRWTASADIGLCFIEDMGMSYTLALPNKFFEYMHAGIPSVCADLPVLHRLIEAHDCGVLIPPGDVEKAAEAVDLLIQRRDYYQGFETNAAAAATKFSWKEERTRLRNAVMKAIAL